MSPGSAPAESGPAACHERRLGVVTKSSLKGALSPAKLRKVVGNLELEWESFVAIELTEAVVRRAGSLAEARGLRGYDAVHLSARLEIRDAGEPPLFGCFDDRLARAARREGLRVAR